MSQEMTIHPRTARAIMDADVDVGSGGAMELLRGVSPETARELEGLIFQTSALQMAERPVTAMAEKGAEALLEAVRQGKHGGRFRFRIDARGDHWEFFGFSGSSHNVHIDGGMELHIED